MVSGLIYGVASLTLVSCRGGMTARGDEAWEGSRRSPTALRMGEGRVAFTGRYDRWLRSVPDEDRAWDLVKSVYDEMAAAQLWVLDPGETEDNWEPDAGLLKAHPELIERLHGVLDRSVLGMPTDELGGVNGEGHREDVNPMIDTLLPQLRMLRVESELLRLDAASSDEPGRVILDLRSMARLQRYCSILDTLIEGLETIEIDSKMCDLVLNDELELSRWDAESLELLGAIFDAPPVWKPATRYIDGERAMEENFMDWVYVDSVNDRLSLRGANRLYVITDAEHDDEGGARMLQNIVGARADQERVLDAVSYAAREDLARPLVSQRVLASSVAMSTGVFAPDQIDWRYMPTALIVPAIDRYVQRVIEIRAQHAAARLMIAAHRHRAKHGSLPSSVESIDTNLLGATPIDPYTGQSLRIAVKDDRVVVYSVGPDRDDDGGRMLLDCDGQPDRFPEFMALDEYDRISSEDPESIDGDWVLSSGE